LGTITRTYQVSRSAFGAESSPLLSIHPSIYEYATYTAQDDTGDGRTSDGQWSSVFLSSLPE
jgi:hypothetical protein